MPVPPPRKDNPITYDVVLPVRATGRGEEAARGAAAGETAEEEEEEGEDPLPQYTRSPNVQNSSSGGPNPRVSDWNDAPPSDAKPSSSTRGNKDKEPRLSHVSFPRPPPPPPPAHHQPLVSETLPHLAGSRGGRLPPSQTMDKLFSRKKTVKPSLSAPSPADVVPPSSSGDTLAVPNTAGIPSSRSREKLAVLVGAAKDMPAANVVNQQFEELLANMALPAAKMDQMRAMPTERKWMLLLQQQAKLGAAGDGPVASPTHDPQAYIDMLLNPSSQTGELAKDLQSLEVALRTEPLSWVKDFVRLGGLDALIQQLQKLLKKPNVTPAEKDCQLYCVRAMKAQLNNTTGLQAAISHPEGVRSLGLGLTCTSLRIQTLTVEVLAAVCFVPPRGHSLILDALESVKKTGASRFQSLVQILRNDLNRDESAQFLEFQISCMTFINAIVNSPDDLAFRVTLRNEFMDLEIGDVLPTLRKINSEELNTQLNIFEEEGAYDYELLAERLQASSPLEFRDVDEVFDCLRERLEDTECLPYLLNVLQSLALLPLDKARRKKYWQLAAEVVRQLSLQRHGTNPDVSRLQLNVAQFIEATTGIPASASTASNLSALAGGGRDTSFSRRSSREARRASVKAVAVAEVEQKLAEATARIRALEGEVVAAKAATRAREEEAAGWRKTVQEKEQRISELTAAAAATAQNKDTQPPATEPRRGLNTILQKAFKSSANTAHSRDSSQAGSAFHARNPSEGSGSGNQVAPQAAAKTRPPPSLPHKPTLRKAPPVPTAKPGATEETPAATVTAAAPPPPPPPPPPMARPVDAPTAAAAVPPPPPPPMIPGGMPPPPPPPPVAPRAAPGGVPPPPPPPGGIPPPPTAPGDPASTTAALPAKPKVQPSVKMRPLAWTKLNPAQVQSTLWKHLAEKRDGEERLRREKVDVKELEELFGMASPAAAAAGALAKSNPALAGEGEGEARGIAAQSMPSLSPTKKQAVTLLDPKRQNNCCIMLGRIRFKFSELRDAVLSVNEAVLTEQIVKQFLGFVPTEEEMGLIRDYLDDGSAGSVEEKIKELGKAEQFFHEMSKIPRYQNRLNSIYFRFRFAERLEELKPVVSTLLSASKQIKESKKLAKTMELILVIGNYMNGDSFRGGAYGFSIETLTKVIPVSHPWDILTRIFAEIQLGDTKTSSGKTFVYYLASLIEKKAPECKDLLAELNYVEKASKLSLVQINQDIAELVKGFRETEAEVKLLEEHPSKQPNDRFVEVFTAFAQQYREPFLDVQGKKSDAETMFKSAVEFYGEDPKTSTPESFFGTFWKFISDLEKARKDVERDQENQRKAAERADKRKSGLPQSPSVDVVAADSTETLAGSKKFARSQEILNSERKGVMDDLISSLKTGEMYRAKLKNRNVQSTALYGSSKTAFGGDDERQQETTAN
ncbi:Dishevelled associated activator of morphogenesis 2 [Phlyctochytrium bullatum]|nr:Dishevelled associated activator of morphogenesis 2 [Phlyctochytrium bullatum]